MLHPISKCFAIPRHVTHNNVLVLHRMWFGLFSTDNVLTGGSRQGLHRRVKLSPKISSLLTVCSVSECDCSASAGPLLCSREDCRAAMEAGVRCTCTRSSSTRALSWGSSASPEARCKSRWAVQRQGLSTVVPAGDRLLNLLLVLS